MAIKNLLEIRVVRSLDEVGYFMSDHVFHTFKRLLCKLDIEDDLTFRL